MTEIVFNVVTIGLTIIRAEEDSGGGEVRGVVVIIDVSVCVVVVKVFVSVKRGVAVEEVLILD